MEEAIKVIAGVLAREAHGERLALDAPIFAAQLFLQHGDLVATTACGWFSAANAQAKLEAGHATSSTCS